MITPKILEYEGRPIACSDIPQGELPGDYLEQTMAAIRNLAYVVPLELGKRSNNRDYDHRGEFLASVVVRGEDLISNLCWVLPYYQVQLREKISEAMGEEAICLVSPNEIVMGNIFGPGMRLEAHTDIWAMNVNMVLKAVQAPAGTPPEFSGGTVIGYPTAESHNEILANRIGIVTNRVGTVSVLQALDYPHTVGLPDVPQGFEMPELNDAFWQHPLTRVSLNFSYTTEEQLRRQPQLASRSDEVGFSRKVLG